MSSNGDGSAVPHTDDPRGHAYRDRTGWQIMGHHGVRPDHRTCPDRHPLSDSGLGPHPNVIPDQHGRGDPALVKDRGLCIGKGMVVVTDGDHLTEEATLADDDATFNGNGAVMPEDGA